MSGAGAAPVNDRVGIVALDRAVAIRGCSGPEVVLGFGPAFEIENLLSGQVGGENVDCLFHNNGYNRPILTCRVADGGAFTLWPIATTPLSCG